MSWRSGARLDTTRPYDGLRDGGPPRESPALTAGNELPGHGKGIDSTVCGLPGRAHARLSARLTARQTAISGKKARLVRRLPRETSIALGTGKTVIPSRDAGALAAGVTAETQ